MPDLFAANDTRVRYSPELQRIVRVPRRMYSEEDEQRFAREMTEAFKTPYGKMELWPKQATILMEFGMYGGAFGPLPVGKGKTLPSLLAAEVVQAKRPLIIIPAKLLEKTRRDARQLREHFVFPDWQRIMTYEWLGRMPAAEALIQYDPDCVALDEAHKLRNLKAAVTRRVRRFFALKAKQGLPVPVLVMSGTMTKRSLHDFWHFLMWVFARDQESMPLPREHRDLEEWADAIDERKGQVKRADPEALQIFCNEEENRIWTLDRRAAARMAFRRRLVETPRVVAAEEGSCDATLTISAVEYDLAPNLKEAFQNLRQTWTLPDGRWCMDGLEASRHARELALGFYYHWDPPAPTEWKEKRKAWAKFVREVLKHSRRWDSELQVRRAHPEETLLKEWQAIQPSFTPATVPVWLDDAALKYCAAWAERERGIIWTEHVVFGERLERDFGIVYYGRKGRSIAGKFIDDHPKDQPFAASIQSNAEGRNLQGWSTALVTSPPPNGKGWEQLLGRNHRPGQDADEVEVDTFFLCLEHATAFWQGVNDALFVEQTTGSRQKILLAGHDVPTLDEVANRGGHLWRK